MRYHFARLTALAAFFLLAAGASVTSTGSGLAVPDWPLSFGLYFPAMVGGVFFEHGHRMIAGVVGIMTFILVSWTWARDARRPVRIAAAGAGLGIILQAVLGGLTVLLKLPPAVSISHACLGQIVFCSLVVLAQFAAPGPKMESLGTRHVRTAYWAILAVFLQLLLGAILRHTGQGLAFHLTWSLVAGGFVAWGAYEIISDKPRHPATAPAGWAAGLLLAQYFLGFGALIVRSGGAPVITPAAAVPTLHVWVGAAILASCVLWAQRARGLTPVASA